MTEKDAILTHLTLYEPTGNPVRFTSYTAALRDARGITKRNPDNGRLDPQAKHGHIGSFLGAIGYLILLDHIGMCFRPKGGARLSGEKPIAKALLSFTKLSREKIEAILELRNRFAHDYGLCTHSRKPGQCFFFLLTARSGELLKLPVKAWDGRFGKGCSEHVTTVDLWELGELVEGICRRLEEMAKNEGLEIALKGGADALQNRYWLMSPMWPA